MSKRECSTITVTLGAVQKMHYPIDIFFFFDNLSVKYRMSYAAVDGCSMFMNPFHETIRLHRNTIARDANTFTGNDSVNPQIKAPKTFSIAITFSAYCASNNKTVSITTRLI